MTDPQTQQGSTTAQDPNTGGAAAVVKDDSHLVDKNKSAEQYVKDVEDRYIIPRMIREKFPNLIKLIYETESMNQEEREYWLQIMPIMTEDQVVKFKEILVNEKNQLAKLDSDYEQEMAKLNESKPKPIDEAAKKEQRENLEKEEESHEESETSKEAELLDALENI
jgi:hypothetical protein